MFATEIDLAIDSLIDSLLVSDGVTVSVTNAPVPDSGYMVGGLDSLTLTRNELTLNRQGVYNTLSRFVSANLRAAMCADVFLGGWIDSADQTVWIDFSQHIVTKDYAMELGKSRGEIAIWDLAANEEIRL